MRGWLIASVAVLVAVGALAVNASGLQPGIATIRITDRVVSERTTSGRLVVKSALYNKGLSPYLIGNSVLVCTPVGAASGPIKPGSHQCMGTYRLAHGNIVVAGVMSGRSFYTLAVTGGTGEYSNAGAGQMAAVTLDLNPRQQQLTFTLYST